MSSSSELSFQVSRFYGSAGPYELFAPLASNENMARDWSGDNFDSMGAACVAIMLKKNTILQSLTLKGGTFTTDEGVLIAKAINQNKSLKELGIQDNKSKLGTDLINAISQVLLRNRSLESLNLENSLHKKCNFSRLAEVAHKSFWLRSLDLSGSVSDAQADGLSDFITMSPALEKLGLRRCYPFGMTALGFTKIVNAHVTSKSLRSLDFSQNHDEFGGIRTAEIEALALSLIGKTHLRTLYLTRNALTPRALDCLSKSLASNKTLWYLMLDEDTSGSELDTNVPSSQSDGTLNDRPQRDSILLSTFRNRLSGGTDQESFLTLYAELLKFHGTSLLAAREAWLTEVCRHWKFLSLEKASRSLPSDLSSSEKIRILSALAAKELSIRAEEVSKQVPLTPSKRPLSNSDNSPPSKLAKVNL